MAKRSPRQEMRAAPTRAPYRRAKAASVPPPVAELPAEPPMAAPSPVVVDEPAPPPPVSARAVELPAFELPDFAAVARSALGFAEAALASLPDPAQLVHCDPSTAASPPGPAPRGDARSLRGLGQFVLIYRSGAALVSRRGELGTHGTWRVVEYPTVAQASHAYASECSRLIDQGFSDVS